MSLLIKIHGHAGAGKTTLAEFLAAFLHEKGFSVCVRDDEVVDSNEASLRRSRGDRIVENMALRSMRDPIVIMTAPLGSPAGQFVPHPSTEVVPAPAGSGLPGLIRPKQRPAETPPEDRLPPLPQPDADSTYPAIETVRITLGRRIMQERIAAQLLREELSRRAGLHPTRLNLIEAGEVSATEEEVAAIDRVLRDAGEERHGQ